MKTHPTCAGFSVWSLTTPSKLLTGMLMMTSGLAAAIIKVVA